MGKNLQDKVFLVTGASSGIGAATALEAAKAGMNLVLGARRVDRLNEVASKARAMGRKVVALACDVDKDEDVTALIDAGLKEFGRIDAAFANAGYGFYESVLDTDMAKARAMFETNYWGTVRVIMGVVPLFLKQGSGHLIVCSSAASEMTPPYFGHYGATKSAQDSLTGALRAELAPKKIHVTSVHPIGTASEFSMVAKDLSSNPPQTPNTPGFFTQTSEQVGRKVVRTMKKSSPAPEVWPNPFMPYLLGIMTMFPRFAAFSLRQHENDLRKTLKNPNV
jgi:short-subunit dehydrogenase